MTTQQKLKEIVQKGKAVFLAEGVDAARSVFDEAAEFAIKYDLRAHTVWTRMSSHPGYRVIALSDPDIAYFSMPKCGSSTVMQWAMEIVKTRQKHKGIRQAQSFDDDPHEFWGYKSEFDLSAYSQHKKITVVRDPLIRFISFFFHYRDRVNRGYFRKNENGLAERIHDVDEFINHFCDNLVHDIHVYLHTLPQSKILCDAYSEMDMVFPIEQLDDLREFLELNYQMAIPELTENTSSRSKLNVDPESIERVVAYYQDDYDLLTEHYNVNDSIEELFA